MMNSRFAFGTALLLSFILASCGSSTDLSYIYDVSAMVVPDTIYSNANRKLELGVSILASERGCWQTDLVGYSKDSNLISGGYYYSIQASMKKPSNATNCQNGYDTLRGRLTITFDSVGTYRLDFPQVDSRGNLITKHYNYTIR